MEAPVWNGKVELGHSPSKETGKGSKSPIWQLMRCRYSWTAQRTGWNTGGVQVAAHLLYCPFRQRLLLSSASSARVAWLCAQTELGSERSCLASSFSWSVTMTCGPKRVDVFSNRPMMNSRSSCLQQSNHTNKKLHLFHSRQCWTLKSLIVKFENFEQSRTDWYHI